MDKKYIFGVDVGGTTVKLGLFTHEGEILDKWEIPTDKTHNGSKILPDVAKAIEYKLAEKNIEKTEVIGLGLGVPGPVDNHGVIHRCVNLGWGEFSLTEETERLTGLRVVANNDANVAALGELWKGSAQGLSNIVLITLGTGVGGGIIIDKKILPSPHGSGGEIGHLTVRPDEVEMCNCGKCGCVEQYASATGIVHHAKALMRSEIYQSPLCYIQSGKGFTAKDVFDQGKLSDPLALHVIDQMGQYLGLALSHAACLCDPEMIVIGGGVSKAGDIIIDAVQKYYNKYVFHSAKDVKFTIATLGNDAGIYGAARQLI